MNRTVSCVFTLLFAGLTLATPQDGKIPFSITISTAQQVFKVGSKVTIRLLFKNTSDGEVPYERGLGIGVEPHGEFFTNVEVRDAKGELAPETEYYRLLRGKPDPSPRPFTSERPKPRPSITGSFVGYLLKSGEAREEDISVSQLYDLSQPGQYTISAWRRLSDVATNPGSKIIAFSNTLAITVTK